MIPGPFRVLREARGLHRVVWAAPMRVREPGTWVVTPFLDLRPGAASGRDVDVARLRREDLTLNPERLGVGHCSADLAML
jgi:hypothetical protein